MSARLVRNTGMDFRCVRVDVGLRCDRPGLLVTISGTPVFRVSETSQKHWKGFPIPSRRCFVSARLVCWVAVACGTTDTVRKGVQWISVVFV